MTIEELVRSIKEHVPSGEPPGSAMGQLRKKMVDSMPDDEVIKMFLHHPSLDTIPSLEKAKQAALVAFDLEDWLNILKRTK
jgi:hypothetical protein